MSPDLIPALDAAGLPGPPWLFHVLLVFTFFLHLVFVNLTLGGTLLAAIAHLQSGGRREDFRGVLSGRLMAVNNYGISLTITTGVAPLLFIQLLYQQYFYSATILIAWFWLSLLALLPPPVLRGVMVGGAATLVPLGLAILLGIGLLMMLARSTDPVRHPALVSGALGAMVLAIAVMSLTRHQVRALYPEPFTSQFTHVVTSQWGTFGLFVVILVAGLATVGYMVRRVVTSPADGADAA